MTEIQQPNPNLPDAAPGRGVPECDGPFQNEVPFQPTNLPMRRPMHCPRRQPFHWPRRSGTRCRPIRRTQATRPKPSKRRDPNLPDAEALPGVAPICPNILSAETLPSVSPICRKFPSAGTCAVTVCRRLAVALIDSTHSTRQCRTCESASGVLVRAQACGDIE